ncbi:ADC synthase [Morchella snyderi]|nr:ADC synthase [Morchella snyderi]
MPSAAPHPHPRPRILLLDAYDSFTANLASLLRTTTGATVHTLRIDALPLPALLRLLPSFDALVVGPGPGHPGHPADIGLAADIWHLAAPHLLPVLGVCLGHQSLCLAFGASVQRLRAAKHGQVSPVTHTAAGLFRGVAEVRAVRYHSLHAVVPPDSDTLEPLAWAHDAENGRVLMAVRHRARPFWGVQYHPESICTVGGGAEVVANWWGMAAEWNRAQGRRRAVGGLPQGWDGGGGGGGVERGLLQRQVEWERASGAQPLVVDKGEKVGRCVATRVVAARGLQVTRVAEMLGVQSAEQFVMLDSAAAPGRWCIFAVLTPGVTRVITYNVGDKSAALSRVGTGDRTQVPLAEYEGSIWRFLAKYMHSRTATGGCPKSPFWGGLVGYFNYEVGVASLDIPVIRDGGERPRVPDVSLAFAQRSIVIDGDTGRAYIQTLLPSDDAWLSATAQRLQLAADMSQTPSTTPHTQSPVPPPTPQFPEILRPSQPAYLAGIAAAQAHLAAGNSYELCLTTTTKILHPRPAAPHPWTLYTTLRARNPAPYAAYLRLAGCTLLSSSPERFLSWTRAGTCQLRPIKGTVRKTASMTPAAAERALRTPKETAENLMIVDLIRHDLHRLAGDTVAVPKLMVVEEYAHVFQLVSVIEGCLLQGVSGFDVLAASLPPGSMTGAPKRRSVQLLRGMEGRERGLYSGVVGYWSVCGAGDWSVVIRSAVRADAEVEEECDVWRIGAGGAITALSVPGEEWEEMVVKAESALRAFVG